MRNFLNFVVRFHFFLLFIVLESFSLYLVVANNKEKNRIFLNSSNAVTGFIYENFNFLKEYLSLREQNEMLARENSQYLNSFENAYKSNIVTRKEIQDKEYQQQYYYIPARVINNSISKQYNYITLDKGSMAGVKPDMAVITTNGIVGVVRAVSTNYASVISVLNPKLGVSARIKKNNYFGSIVWEDRDYNTVSLKEIPNHVEISAGDTVITSGFSIIFPEGIPIGTITKFSQAPGGNFYDITVKLSTNFKTLSYVYVVQDLLKPEREALENSIDYD